MKKFIEYVHYTIPQLAEFAHVTPEQFIDILMNCNYLSTSDYMHGYEISFDGEDLDGIYCDLPNDEFGLMFLGDILENNRFLNELANLDLENSHES